MNFDWGPLLSIYVRNYTRQPISLAASTHALNGKKCESPAFSSVLIRDSLLRSSGFRCLAYTRHMASNGPPRKTNHQTKMVAHLHKPGHENQRAKYFPALLQVRHLRAVELHHLRPVPHVRREPPELVGGAQDQHPAAGGLTHAVQELPQARGETLVPGLPTDPRSGPPKKTDANEKEPKKHKGKALENCPPPPPSWRIPAAY